MSYRGPNQFQNQFNAPHQQQAPLQHFGVPPRQPHTIGPITSSKSPLEQFEHYSKKIEDLIDEKFKPLKPYVPAIGRAFLVATFMKIP